MHEEPFKNSEDSESVTLEAPFKPRVGIMRSTRGT